jgi:diadenosine tetraphosphate (Ap4A) HIT family hydrolase
MYNPDNIFAKIIRNEVKTEKLYEDEHVVAFNDINPSAPVHVLVVPKKEYISFDDFSERASDYEIANFFRTVRKIAKDLEVDKSGYRLITNHGSDAAQTIKHFHVHILGKKFLGPLVMGDTHHK